MQCDVEVAIRTGIQRRRGTTYITHGVRALARVTHGVRLSVYRASPAQG